jgi:hypothetical protein
VRPPSYVLITALVWLHQPSCTSYHLFAGPHDAPCERCDAPDDAPCELCAVPDDAPCDLHGALDAVPYRTLPERTLLEQRVLEQRVLERRVLVRLAVPEPQHLTLLARWPAPQSPPWRLIREGKRRLDARSFFHSCLNLRRFLILPRDTY